MLRFDEGCFPTQYFIIISGVIDTKNNDHGRERVPFNIKYNKKNSHSRMPPECISPASISSRFH